MRLKRGLGVSVLALPVLTSVGCDYYYKLFDTSAAADSAAPASDSAAPTGAAPLGVDTVGWGCDEDSYWFEVYTTGLATDGWLYIYQTNSATPWDEDHPLDIHEADTAGDWSLLYLALDSVYPDYTAVVSGQSTLYPCSDDSPVHETLTFIIEVEDAHGADCVVWGHNPNGAPADECQRVVANQTEQLR